MEFFNFFRKKGEKKHDGKAKGKDNSEFKEIELVLRYKTDGSIYSVSITPDGSYIAAGSSDNKIYLFDRSGKLLWSYETGSWVWSVSITPDGSYIAAGNVDGNVYLFDRNGKLLWKYSNGNWSVVSITPDGSYIVAAGGGDGNVYLFDRNGKLLWKYRTKGAIYSISITPSGEYIVAAGGDKDGNVYLFDRNGKLLWKYKIYTGGQRWSVSITPDGSYIAAGGRDDGNVYLFDRNGKLLWKYRTKGAIYSISITPSGEYIVAAGGDKDGNVYLFDRNGKLLWKYSNGNWSVVSITPDGSYIAAGNVDGNVYLFAEFNALLISLKKDIRRIVNDVKELCILPQEIFDEMNEIEIFLKESQKDAIARAKEFILKIDKIAEELSPFLTVEMNKTNFKPNTWEKIILNVKNKGKASARDIILTFSDEVVVKNLEKIEILKPNDEKSIEFALMPKAEGSIPLDIKITYIDHKNKERSDKQTLWINVGAEVKPEKLSQQPLTPAEFEPKPIMPKTLPPELSEFYTEAKLLGKGGFAKVFKAKRKDGKIVAVKIPISFDPTTGKSFIRELMNWTKLSHPNIVKVYDYNILPIPYFEMELCDKSLAELDKPLDPEYAAWLMFNVCEGLKYAHRLGIIHRDLKPQNILLKDNIPKITDWGLSKIMAESTSTSISSFTPYYAAPEQITNKEKDERTDIWQIGVIFYELVTGELPFKGENLVEVEMAIATEQPALPSSINPQAKEIEPIIMKCLEKNKDKRYQSVEELQRDLAEYLGVRYQESLKLSLSQHNLKRSAYYCGELIILNLKIGELVSAYKYATDLANYADGDIKSAAEELCEQLKARIEAGIRDVAEELIERAELVAHKVRMGFGRFG